MTRYYIKTKNIDYYVGYEDVVDNDEEYVSDEELNKRVALVKRTLPQELEFDVTCEKEDLDDQIADTISNITCWLINGCDYDVIKEIEL